jgi:hypothetical protein
MSLELVIRCSLMNNWHWAPIYFGYSFTLPDQQFPLSRTVGKVSAPPTQCNEIEPRTVIIGLFLLPKAHFIPNNPERARQIWNCFILCATQYYANLFGIAG